MKWLHNAFMPPLLALLLLVLVWEIAADGFHVAPVLLPSPRAIAIVMVNTFPDLLANTLYSLRTLLAGFALSLLVALPLAMLIASSRLLASALYPLLVVVQSIPKVALAPILIVYLGTSEAPRIIITFLVAFFPLVIASATGLLATPEALIRLSRSLRASPWQEMFLVRLPCAVPHIFSGLKVSATLSVIGVVVAEFVAADHGLGYLLVSATAFFNTELAYAAVILLSAISILAFQAVVWVQKLFFRWSMAASTSE